ncbi:MAG: hypothetical protein ACYDBQ_05780 [Thermoplasmatota archaeon]
MLPQARNFGGLYFDATGWVAIVVAILVVALFVHLAAHLVLDRGGFLQALGTTVLGFLLAGVAVTLVAGTWGLVLGLVVWALVAAIVYRTGWLKGAIVGLVAYVLGLLVQWLVGLILH